MTRTPIQLVWLKRDLRLDDHLPLSNACRAGTTVALYVFEPQLWRMPEFDRSHFDFIVQSLRELASKLKAIGG
ncbi:MAG: deoxyribodipyrimidine photo-lyase, partial [Pirellula sp.]